MIQVCILHEGVKFVVGDDWTEEGLGEGNRDILGLEDKEEDFESVQRRDDFIALLKVGGIKGVQKLYHHHWRELHQLQIVKKGEDVLVV